MKFAVFPAVLLLAACASAPPKPACTHEHANSIALKAAFAVIAEVKEITEKRPLDFNKLKKNTAALDIVNNAFDSLAAGDDEVVCTSIRKLAAKRGYDIE